MCFFCVQLCFILCFTYRCLQIIIHKNLWNQLELSHITKFGDYLSLKDAELMVEFVT